MEIEHALAVCEWTQNQKYAEIVCKDTTTDDIDYTVEQLSEVLKAAEKTGGDSKIVSLG